MIPADKRNAVFLLHKEGMESLEIAKRLSISRNAVTAIIEQEGLMPQVVRPNKFEIDEELLKRLYLECDGRIQRVHEKLEEEEGIEVKYSTLTHRLRKLGISKPQKTRCQRVPDEPGVEMQHDTSDYKLKVGDKKIKVIASLLYLRYSKRRYLKFYRSFNRFKMKCFFHEALMHWGYSAPNCIIDNTNLARLRGTGSNAVINPQMETFAKQYGFKFCCHAIGHSNRKAGEERSFWTVETNFFPGRVFKSLEDLNAQALQWSTVRMEKRPQGKVNLIPAKVFEHERSYLVKLSPHLPAPYQTHVRSVDQYGYSAFEGNYYWVPGDGRQGVELLEYSNRLHILRHRECLAQYQLPAQEVKRQCFSPAGLPKPIHKPRNRKKSAQQEQQRLRAIGDSANAYLDFVMKTKGLQRHEFVRKLFRLSQRMTPELFLQSIERALKYEITCIETIQRISILYMQQGNIELPVAQVDEHFQERDTYQEGALSDQPDLSIYDKLLEQDHE